MVLRRSGLATDEPCFKKKLFYDFETKICFCKLTYSVTPHPETTQLVLIAGLIDVNGMEAKFIPSSTKSSETYSICINYFINLISKKLQ